jgi:methyl-accepting chemotaxis protein
MDERNADREVVAAADGVTLRKRFEAAEFHQPAVVYEFESDREAAVTVRVIEGIPDGMDPADIGFLGSSVDRFWEVKGPKLVFENPIEPNAAFTTACTARGERADAIRDLLGQPEVFEVSEAGSAGSSPQADFTRSAAADGQASSEPESTAETDEATPEPSAGDPIVEQFVAELRAGEVSPESVAFLRDELGTAEQPRRSVEARLKQVQTDVADVRAYTNALEAFIDEKGSAREVIDRFEATLANVEESVDAVDARADANEADLADVRADLATLQDDVDSLAGELETVATGLESLEDSLEAVEARLPEGDVEARLDDIDAELAEVATFTDSLRDAFRD